MRARSDARDRHLLNQLRVAEITRPEDARLGDLVALLERTFTDPNAVLGLDRIRQFLSDNVRGGPRLFHVLVADVATRIVGLSIFSYVPRSNCGFSEYLVVDQDLRGQGLGRMLFEKRKALLDVDAVGHGHRASNGLFIEVDSPWRTPPDLLAADTFDAVERVRIFDHLGFRRVAIAYVQPPLAPGKAPVDHMDLLFAPWSTDHPSDSMDAAWITATLEAIWSAWAPGESSVHLAQLRQQLTGGPRVALVDPLNPH